MTVPPTPAMPSQPAPAVPRQSRAWVPIRSLSPRHRARIVAHLETLDGSDRYLRFGHPATDAQIASYVEQLDFARDEVFGIFNRRLELIAMAHLAHAGALLGGVAGGSEFGVSVLPRYRGCGFGAELFGHAMLHARNRGVELLLIHALTQNRAMLKIARRAGATVVRDGSDTAAWLKLPPDSLRSHVDEMVGRQAAELDYGLKRQARRVGGLFDAGVDSGTADSEPDPTPGE